MPYERYTLILQHDQLIGGRESLRLEPPFVMEWVVDRAITPNNGVIFNEMLEKFTQSVLERYADGENSNG